MGKTKGAAMLEAAIEEAGGKAALAKKLGVYIQNVDTWLNGGEPRFRTMQRLKAKLGIPYDAWVEDVDDRAVKVKEAAAATLEELAKI
jgi:DNA-binding phage protein